MTVSPQNELSYLGVEALNPPNLIKALVNPTSSQYKFPIGTLWVNTANNSCWQLSDVSGVTATWTLLGSGSTGAINGIAGDTGGTEVPLAGVFNIKGTAAQVAVTGSAHTETISLIGPYTPATYTAHGVLVGEGASSIVATAAGTNGQVLLGSTGADPAFGTLTTSTGVAFTTGAHSLAVNVKSFGFAISVVSGVSQAVAAQTCYIATNASLVTFTLPALAAVGDTFIITTTSAATAGWQLNQNNLQTIYQGGLNTTTGTGGNVQGSTSSTATFMCDIANTEWVVIDGQNLAFT